MKIVRLSCPDCGAPLEADADKDVFFCGYCGRKIILDQENGEKEFTFKNARQAGYEFERGRMDARFQDTEATELADRIQELIEPTKERDKLILDKRRAYTEKQRLEHAHTNATSGKARILLYLKAVGIAFLTLCICASMDMHFLLVFLLTAVAGAISFFVLREMHRNRIVTLRKDIRDNRTRYRRVSQKLAELEENYDFELVPSEYRDEEAMEYFYKMLVTERAKNLEQAIIYYEEYLAAEEDRERHREQIRLQREQIEEMKKLRASNQASANQLAKSGKAENTLAAAGLLLAGSSLLKEINKLRK